MWKSIIYLLSLIIYKEFTKNKLIWDMNKISRV